MSKARGLADLGNVYDDGALSNRNLIINGAMQVAQRSSSTVSVSNGSNEGYQTLDRFEFQYGNSAGGVANISQDTTVPSGYGFSNSYKVDVTTADTSLGTNHQIYISYRVEAQDIRNSGWNYTDPSSFITCSFWARSVKEGTYCFALRANDSASTRIFVKEFDLVADTWKKVIITIPGEAELAFNNDNGIGATLTWSLQAEAGRATATDDAWNSADTSLATSNQVNFYDSTSNNFFLTGVQLELGDTATPFEHRSYGDELAKCQRYYQKSFNQSDAAGTATNEGGIHIVAWGDGNGIGLNLPVTMRAAGAWTLWPTNSTTSGKVNSFNTDRVASISYPSEHGYSFMAVTSGTANEYIRFQYAVDAEL